MIQINVCDTRWHAAFVPDELSFKRIRMYLLPLLRTYRITRDFNAPSPPLLALLAPSLSLSSPFHLPLPPRSLSFNS